MFSFGSLFSGIGGLDLGLERAGMVCKWQVENDWYATKVLKKHWPDVPKFSDVHDVGAHNLTPVDCIAGGFPCQDISQAGKGAGLSGERSGLWKEQFRIISELRPRYALVENVAALRTKGLSEVIADFSSIGYNAEWNVVSAASVGALHLRKRLFIVAYPNSNEYSSSSQCGRCNQDGSKEPSQRLCSCNTVSYPGSDGWETLQLQHRILQEQGKDTLQESRVRYSPIFVGPIRRWETWTTESGLGRVANGTPDRLDRLRCIGNAVVPQVAEFVGDCLLKHAERTSNV